MPAEAGTALLAAPLASYTGALLSDTAVPTWNAARDELPFVFVSSACMAASGAAMVTTPTAQTGPARSLAAVAAVGEVVSMKIMKKRMHPAEAEPLEQGPAGTMLKWAERLTIAGAAGSTLLGGRRTAAAASGLMMLSASALTRLGILRAKHRLCGRPSPHHRAAEGPPGSPSGPGHRRRLHHHRQLSTGRDQRRLIPPARPSGPLGTVCPMTG